MGRGLDEKERLGRKDWPSSALSTYLLRINIQEKWNEVEHCRLKGFLQPCDSKPAARPF